jgi:proline iminopeptidase
MATPMASEGFIPVTGGQVWYSRVGTNGAIPLLVLHAGPGLDSSYLASLESLADERPVIRYDQLGGGQSEHPEDVHLWTIERFVEELDQVRSALNLTHFHLFGHSWGSTLAIAYTLTDRTKPASLILASPWLSIPRSQADMTALRRKLPAVIQAVLDEHERAGTTNSPAYNAAALEFYRRHLCRLDWFIDAVEQALSTGDGMPPVFQYMQGPSDFTITGTLKDYDCTPQLHEVTLPTLLTCGRYDEITPETTAWYQSLLPKSEMIVFEQSAHMQHLEEPETYLRAIRDFLCRVELRG